jgi:hypothetical protein
MKRIGLTLLVISFLAGAYLAVLDATEVDWVPFVIVLVGGFVGVVLTRRADKSAAGHQDVVEANTQVMLESLDHVVAKVESLTARLDSMDVYDVPAAIDGEVLEHLNKFVANRDTIKHAFGLQAFADIMSHYAGGERYLNRVWSASADGYIDEAALYLPRALEQFTLARSNLTSAVNA